MASGKGPEQTARAILFGNISWERQQQIAEYLAGIGVQARFFADSIDESLKVEQHFETIRSPEEFILREGFDDFQLSHQEYRAGLVASLFSGLVEVRPSISRDTDSYRPQPIPGIIVKSRIELGIPAYPYKYKLPAGKISPSIMTVDYAIQAGSLVETARPLIAVRDSGIERVVKQLNKHDHAHIAMAERLLSNFQQS